MENLYVELKTIIKEAVKKVNKQEPKNFEVALEKLNEELSEIKCFKAYKHDYEVIAMSFYDEDIAHVSGMFLTSSDYYSLFEDESEIFFFEDAELEKIEEKYLTLTFADGKGLQGQTEFAMDMFKKLPLKEKLITIQNMNSSQADCFKSENN